jgi:hypothetical protein
MHLQQNVELPRKLPRLPSSIWSLDDALIDTKRATLPLRVCLLLTETLRERHAKGERQFPTVSPADRLRQRVASPLGEGNPHQGLDSPNQAGFLVLIENLF